VVMGAISTLSNHHSAVSIQSSKFLVLRVKLSWLNAEC
jgi:hypothetical protein